jgi:glycosyltransferase involved in cell wall biosynthesis
MKTRVAFLIRRLECGGAERQLIELARALNKDKFEVTIITFYGGGAFFHEVATDAAISVRNLEKDGPWDVLKFLVRLVRTVRQLRPHIIHGYLTVANELSVLAGRICGARIVWGLRAGDAAIRQSRVEWWLFRVGALLSPQADRIIMNSEFGRFFHASRGYCADRITVIPNGVDIARFTILPRERANVRAEWGVGPDELLIGRVGRFDPLKDYPSFLRAAAQVSRKYSNAKFVCIGHETDGPQLRRVAEEIGIADRMIWAGGRTDMAAVYNALDICVSTSISEGFPNSVAEPMACGTPCVVTDVGDSALLVADAGVTVPAQNVAAIADGIVRMIVDHGRYCRERVRRRITDNFSVDRLGARTEAEFERLLLGDPR